MKKISLEIFCPRCGATAGKDFWRERHTEEGIIKREEVLCPDCRLAVDGFFDSPKE